MKKIIMALACIVFALIALPALAQFTYTGGVLSGSQTYDGAVVDSGLNPDTIGNSGSDCYIGNGGGVGTLTVLSGTLTINNDDFKIANNGNAVGTLILGANAVLNINNIGDGVPASARWARER